MSFVADHVDAALEWSVVGSFTRIGSALRRRLDHWAPLDERSLVGRVVVMTGATSGLGLEAARAFAAMGATVEIIARNPAKAEATCAEIRQATGNPKIGFVVADTGDLAALRGAAADLVARHPAIHVLIHNAGALEDVRQTSPQGIELTVAQQITMLLLLMVTSKGMAGVPRASLVVIAATLSYFHIPESGLLLILAVDHFLDMGRSATNVIGNSIAAAVVAKWEGELTPTVETAK